MHCIRRYFLTQPIVQTDHSLFKIHRWSFPRVSSCFLLLLSFFFIGQLGGFFICLLCCFSFLANSFCLRLLSLNNFSQELTLGSYQEEGTQPVTQDLFREWMLMRSCKPKWVVADMAFFTPSWMTFWNTHGAKTTPTGRPIGRASPWSNRAETNLGIPHSLSVATLPVELATAGDLLIMPI